MRPILNPYERPPACDWCGAPAAWRYWRVRGVRRAAFACAECVGATALPMLCERDEWLLAPARGDGARESLE